ncbi:MAG TPA: branched-chain amino acid ABC transporter permease, partial [Kiloniellales bacterium]|nr:branched-chain amino acid ABC transporter permease [Kiloniellales bacterium]
GIMNFINLAHGSLFMVGAYAAYVCASAFGSLWLALPVAIASGLLLGALLERSLFRFFYGREHLYQVLLTYALVLLFEEARAFLVGNDFHAVPVPTVLDFSVPVTANFSYSAYRLFVLALCLVLALLFFFFIERTRFGARVRAAAFNRDMVEALGLDVKRIFLAVFAIGTAMAVLAGALAAPLYSVYPGIGDSFLIISFVVVVSGGVGSVMGAFWAALLIGLVDQLGKALLPELAGMLVYLLMAGVLLWRPTGLFGRAA